MSLGGNGRWRTRRDGSPRRVSPMVGCLFWVLVALIVLLVLSILFGGFQKGTKAGLGSPRGQGLKPATQELSLGGVPGQADR